MDSIDLDAFRAKQNGRPQPASRKRLLKRRLRGWFLTGPIPGDWLQRAAALPGRALHVALAVWLAVALEKQNEARLTGRLLLRFGVQPDAGRRGLAALERAGLVVVMRHPGRCSIVSIVTTREPNT